LSVQSDFIQPLSLQVENITARLYVQPDFVYGITLPEPDEARMLNRDVELPVSIGIIGTDSTELNMLMFDFQEQYNRLFTSEDNRYISRASIFKRADSLQKLCDQRYAAIHQPFFKNYIRYAIGSVNASVSRGENYLINGYILGKPILYQHSEYMQFFKTCFKGYLHSVASHYKGQTLYHLISVKSDYRQLSAFLKQDPFLKNDSLRELVVISNLWDFYFSAEFDPDAVENMVGQINEQTAITEHRHMTATMLAFFNKMQVGSPAPDFSARTRDGKMGSLGSLKGRFIYLNFFSTKNTSSLKEMPKIAALKKKYGNKLTFLSICVDDNLEDYQQYLRSNPRIDWNVWFNADKSITQTAKEKYFVTGSEAYFLIDNFGHLAQAPALSPSMGIEYRFNAIFKIKQRTTKTGIR
jgi:peroxiredoxin